MTKEAKHSLLQPNSETKNLTKLCRTKLPRVQLKSNEVGDPTEGKKTNTNEAKPHDIDPRNRENMSVTGSKNCSG